MKKIALLLFAALAFTTCSKDDDNPEDSSFNLFSVDDDITFGKQTDSTILADPGQYPILDPGQYPEAYQYVENIR
ncbi:MAG: peptidase M48, partial [Bacteroidota bacterium]